MKHLKQLKRKDELTKVQRRIERIDKERKRQHGNKIHREIVLSYYFNEY